MPSGYARIPTSSISITTFRPVPQRRDWVAELALETRIGAQRIALENLLLVLGRERNDRFTT
jgi:hypothetical protein